MTDKNYTLLQMFDDIAENYSDLWELANGFQSETVTDNDAILGQENAWERIREALKGLNQ